MARSITVSYSELDTARQCGFKHKKLYLERWHKPKDETTAAGRGTLWHQTLAAHYTAIKDGEDAELAAKRELAAIRSKGTDPDVCDLIEWMYEGHLEQWGHDQQWDILEVEHRFEVPLLNANGNRTRFKLKGYIDLVVRDRETDRVWVVDHKSCGNLPKRLELDMDDQFGLYLWALGQLGMRPMGSIHSSARTKRNKVKPQPLNERFDRYYMARTPRELRTIALEALDTARWAHSKLNPHERSPRPDTCSWRCDLTESCLIARKNGEERGDRFLDDTGWTPGAPRH
jgi:RecB family exonuclease